LVVLRVGFEGSMSRVLLELVGLAGVDDEDVVAGSGAAMSETVFGLADLSWRWERSCASK
jgi:hypothetical protein